MNKDRQLNASKIITETRLKRIDKTSLEQIRNDPNIINSFDYSNYIHSNIPIETVKLNEEH